MASKDRPRIIPPPTLFRRVTDWVCVVLLVALVWVAWDAYQLGSPRVPTKFDLAGKAVGFGSAAWLWLGPVLGAVLVGFLTLLRRVPHQFNYLVKITPENAAGQYSIALDLLSLLRVPLLLVLGAITWEQARYIRDPDGPSTMAALWVAMGLLVGVILWGILRATRQR